MTELPTVAHRAVVPGQRSRPAAEAVPVALPSLLRERPRRRECGRERRASAAIVVGMLLVMLALALGAVAYLWVVSDAWQQRAESAESQRSQLVSTSEQLQQRVHALQADLDASDARVEQLAAEKARATDLREAADR